jgi:hypothetical protein
MSYAKNPGDRFVTDAFPAGRTTEGSVYGVTLNFGGHVRAYVRRRWQRIDVAGVAESVRESEQGHERLKFRLRVGGVDYPPFVIGVVGISVHGSGSVKPVFQYEGLDDQTLTFDGFKNGEARDYREDFHLQDTFVRRLVMLCERWYLEYCLCRQVLTQRDAA